MQRGRVNIYIDTLHNITYSLFRSAESWLVRVQKLYDDIFVYRKHCWGFHDIKWHCLDSLGPEQWGLVFGCFWWVCDRTTVTKKCRFQSSFEATSRKYVADTCNEFPALQFEILYCDGPLSTLSPCVFFVCPESLSQRVRVSRRFAFMEVLEPDPMSIKQRTHFCPLSQVKPTHLHWFYY